MSEYTKKPWIAVGTYVEIESETAPDICDTHPASIDQGHLKRSYGEMCANARLIAAAPDLLEALVDVLENVWFEKKDETKSFNINYLRDRAEQAIEKAKGEE